MGKYTRDLSSAPAIDKESITVVSEETTNETYKVTLQDLLNSSFKDLSAFTSALGTITKSVGTTATLSSPTDYANISVGDVLVINGAVTNIVISKDAGTDITVLTSNAVSAATFTYGEPAIVTKNNLGDIKNAISSGGAAIDGTFIVTGDSEFDGDVSVGGVVKSAQYQSDPIVGYNEIRSGGGATLIQKNIDDGMIITPFSPGLYAALSADQAVTTLSTWVRVNFNVANGSDPANATFNRVPSGEAGYDTTNHVMPIPYSSEYPSSVYLIYASIAFTADATAGNLFYIRISSGPNATTDVYELGEKITYFPVTSNTQYQFNLSRIVSLHPNTDSNHRYVSITVWHNCTSLTIQSGQARSSFCMTCLG
jgi:hypothetical protein